MSSSLKTWDIFNPSGGQEWQSHLNSLKRMYSDVKICRVPTASPLTFTPVSQSVAHMKYFGYSAVDDLIDLDKSIGTGQCAALIQHYVKGIGLTKTWVPGPRVQDLDPASIPKGTVIATFWNGKYPNESSGNHVAFYLSHSAKGIKVVEQWKGVTVKEARSKRSADGIRFKSITIPTDQSGAKPKMTNIAEYYYVVLDKR